MATTIKTVLSTIAVLILSTASYSSADEWIPNTKCVTVWECTGPSLTGTCQPQGMVCIDDHSCRSYYDPNGEYVSPNQCSWTSSGDCVTATNKRCRQWSSDWIASDCNAYCKLAFYNVCICTCKNYEGQGVEVGHSTYCEDQDVCN